MKKLYTLLAVLSLLVIPFAVFAAVDVTLTDISTEDTNSISINVDTQADTLEKVVLPIKFSSGIQITEVIQGTIEECTTLNYSNSSEDTILVNCEMDEAATLDGTLANISFTTTEENYSFEVLDDTNLELGTLALGDVVNIGELDQEDTTYTTNDVTEEETTLEDEQGIPFEEDALITAQDEVSSEVNEGFSIDNITEYLPYILIGGSVILLISIIAILLGKKKSPKTPKKSQTKPSKRTTPKPPTQKDTPQDEPTLKSMVNSVEHTTKQPPAPKPPKEQENQETDQVPFNSGLNTQPQSISQPPQQQPPTQKTNSPEIAPKTQEEDLQEILKREGLQSPLEEQKNQENNQVSFNDGLNIQTEPTIEPTSSNPNIEATTPQPKPPQTPPEDKEPYMQESPTLKKPDYELQENIDREINQIKRTSPSTEAPGVVPPDQNPPATDLNTDSLPSQPIPTPSDEYPPVPPSAQQPNQQGNQQNIQQGSTNTETPEKLPETPPAM